MAKNNLFHFAIDFIGLSKRCSYTRNLFSLTSLFLYTSFVYSAIALLIEDAIYLKRTLTDILACSVSLVLWHQIQLQSKKISSFLCIFEKLSKKYFSIRQTRKSSHQINCSVSFFISIYNFF